MTFVSLKMIWAFLLVQLNITDIFFVNHFTEQQQKGLLRNCVGKSILSIEFKTKQNQVKV